MIRKKVWRYWCEFCGKRNCSAASISKHEKHCTMNPGRTCRMCAHVENKQTPIAELIAVLSLQKPDYGMAELRDLAHQCPVCILAAIRQSKIQIVDRTGREEEYLQQPDFKFNFKKEVEDFWRELNDKSFQDDLRNDYYTY